MGTRRMVDKMCPAILCAKIHQASYDEPRLIYGIPEH